MSDAMHAGLRGTIGAMAMTGVRAVTVDLGLVEQPPPQAVVKRRARGLLRRVPRRHRRAAMELVHWTYGGVGGVAFGLLPDGVRRRAWAGPGYGLLAWLGFELGIGPVLGIPRARHQPALERLALAADHLVYGFVLSEMRRRPQE